MKTHVLRGSKHEIAENLVRIAGEVREVIVFEEDPHTPKEFEAADDIFAEMQGLMVDVPQVEDSRQAIYSRVPGE